MSNRIADSSVYGLRSEARSAVIDPGRLAVLAASTDKELLMTLAERDLPARLVAQLAGNPDAAVRRHVARRAKLSDDLLEQLSRDADHFVRGAIASRPGLPENLVERLARDGHHDVRRCVAERVLPVALCEELARDPDPYVCAAALAQHSQQAPEVIDRLVAEGEPCVREVLARRRDLSPAQVERLAHDPVWWVRRWVAWRTDLAASVVEKLARDPEPFVRSGVARCAPAELAEAMVGDSAWQVRRSLARRPGLSQAVADRLAADDDCRVREAISVSRSRAALADKAFSDYDFGDGVEVIDADGWEYMTPGTERSRKVYVETEREDDGPAPRWTLNFTVLFNESDGALKEAYAIDEKGQIWGSMPVEQIAPVPGCG